MTAKDENAANHEPEEEEEEEEVVNPQDVLREKCAESSHCRKYKDELGVCEERVNSRSKTEETCTQELFDFLHCKDHCVRTIRSAW